MSSPTRTVFAGGAVYPTFYNVMDKIEIATTGNAIDFGENALDFGDVVGRNGTASCSSSTRGIIAGGDAGSGQTDHIDYVTIASTGNATDLQVMQLILVKTH